MVIETMNDEIETLSPVKVKINLLNYIKLFFMALLSIVLWIALFVTGLNIFAYYVYSVFTNGFFDPESLKYGLMVAIGSYFCLIIDRNKIYESLNVKKDLPFLTIKPKKK